MPTGMEFGDAAVSVEAPDPPAGYVGDPGDCDDTENTIHPGTPDPLGDGIDQNCNGADG